MYEISSLQDNSALVCFLIPWLFAELIAFVWKHSDDRDKILKKNHFQLLKVQTLISRCRLLSDTTGSRWAFCILMIPNNKRKPGAGRGMRHEYTNRPAAVTFSSSHWKNIRGITFLHTSVWGSRYDFNTLKGSANLQIEHFKKTAHTCYNDNYIKTRPQHVLPIRLLLLDTTDITHWGANHFPPKLFTEKYISIQDSTSTCS